MSVGTTPRQHILPPQATPLERAVDQAIPAWDILADSFPAPSVGEATSFLPWLAAEWTLAPFARYFPDTPTLIDQGLPWLMERGTAAAVQRVLRWLGFPDAVVDEDEAYLHIDLGRSATTAEINHIAHVVRATAPAHVRFWRVYHNYDLRPVRLDDGPELDNGLLDDDSGVWVSVDEGEPIKASFGERHTGNLPAFVDRTPLPLHTDARLTQIVYDDRLQLDAWRLDSQILVDAFGGIGESFNGTAAAPRRLNPKSVSGIAHITSTVRTTVPPEYKRTDCASTELPAPLNRAHGWVGRWNKSRWRPLVIESIHSESF